MSQPGFDWSGDVNKPVSGRTSRSRHSSATGAQAAASVHGARTLAYLALLGRHADGLNDDTAGRLLGIYRTSVCSIRNAVMDVGLVEETGRFDVATFGSRSTRRQRYRLTPAGRVLVEARA